LNRHLVTSAFLGHLVKTIPAFTLATDHPPVPFCGDGAYTGLERVRLKFPRLEVISRSFLHIPRFDRFPLFLGNPLGAIPYRFGA